MDFPGTNANCKPVPMLNEARTGGFEWENGGTTPEYIWTESLD